MLLPDGSIEQTDLVVSPEGIERIGEPAGRAATLRADGFLILPGLIDLHGDAFERQLMPRPRVSFDPRIALRDTDRQLVANGITTAFHALTYSWEPGLRGREAALAFLDTLDSLQGELACDTRLHLRQETFNLDAVDEIEGWIGAGRVQLLAFNDHVEHIRKETDSPEKLARYADRSGLATPAFLALLARVSARADEVPEAVARLAAAARRAGVTMASHDDETPEIRAHYHALGAMLCEFPLDARTAEAAQALGSPVIMGAPNIVRGGSHADRFSAHEAFRRGLCSVLTSDYYYPAMHHAAFRLVRDGDATLGAAWRAVSTDAAKAAGLSDRGEIATGRRADLVLVNDERAERPVIAATMAGGRIVHLADARLLSAAAASPVYA